MFIIWIYLSLKLFLCIIAPCEKGDYILQQDVTILLNKLDRAREKEQPKLETLSKRGNTKKNKKALLLTASSKYGVWQTNAYSILQCPHTVDSFHRGLRCQFQQFICSMEGSQMLFIWNWTYLSIFYLELNIIIFYYNLFIIIYLELNWSNWGGHIPQSSTVQLICSASKGK